MDRIFRRAEAFFTDMARHQAVICYGAGSKARQTLPLLRQQGIEPQAMCDSNESLWGSEFEPGLPILSLTEVRKKYKDYCLVLTVASQNAAAILHDLRSSGEGCAIFHMANPFKVDDCLLQPAAVEKDKAALAVIRSLLADAQSQRIFDDFLFWKLTGNIFPLVKQMVGDRYFDADLLHTDGQQTYVDVGTYTGDSIMQYLLFCSGHYHRIVGFEADSSNYKATLDFVRYSKMTNIEIRNTGLWSQPVRKKFYTCGDGNPELFDSPNFFQDIGFLIDKRYKRYGCALEEMPLDTLDNQLCGLVPSLLKVNALAADLEILHGGRKTIETHRPAIILEYGCRPAYILEEPQFIKECYPDYKLYLRVKDIYGDVKTIFYTIP